MPAQMKPLIRLKVKVAVFDKPEHAMLDFARFFVALGVFTG
jgi:hypothetical protein